MGVENAGGLKAPRDLGAEEQRIGVVGLVATMRAGMRGGNRCFYPSGRGRMEFDDAGGEDLWRGDGREVMELKFFKPGPVVGGSFML